MAADDPQETQHRLAAYMAFLDAVVPESAYWLRGDREDADRVQLLADAVTDPSTLRDRTDDERDR